MQTSNTLIGQLILFSFLLLSFLLSLLVDLPIRLFFTVLFLVFFFFHFLEDFSSVRPLSMYSQIPEFSCGISLPVRQILQSRFRPSGMLKVSIGKYLPIFRVRQSKKSFIFLGLFCMQLLMQFSY